MAREVTAAITHDPNHFTLAAGAPFLGIGAPSSYAPTDRNGQPRTGKVDLGPIELP
jgi:hypothetical protein